MEIAKFKEAKKQVSIIDACDYILDVDIDCATVEETFDGVIEYKDRNGLVLKLLSTDSQVRRSFLRWVANEKKIAEKKLAEI